MTLRPPQAAFLLALLTAALLPFAAGAQTVPETAKQRYRDCMQLARSDPLNGQKEADAWIKEGGGGPAEHCRAVVDATLGRYESAAGRFEKLADSMKDSEQRARVLGQAGQAWMLAGNLDKAYEDQSRAVTLLPNDPDLLVDRSLILASQQRYWDAIDDLNKVLDLRPDSPEALIFRASAYRLLKVPELAKEDITRALTLVPDHPEALLERGLLSADTGDKEGALKDLQKVIELAPDSPAADVARNHLAALSASKG
ncbi:Tetratricopeptide repeat-containing protein [Tistlia consotensis]|nr:tetratricopeptide repeat protein [Tistlia consotensis]SNR28556.1 Tetratricopeptide repeat-containing protein [Tistlia consotensis]